MKPVVIIGGGITGLCAAYELEKLDQPYVLLEASGRLGGKIATERVDGFIIEGGADSFVSYKPWATQLIFELGLGDDLIGTNDKKRNTYLLRGGKLHDIPRGLRMIVPMDEQGLLEATVVSDECKQRMLDEVNVPPRQETGDESLATFAIRRFGKEALDVFADPMMGGIYTGNPATLSMLATFPNYLQMEQKYGSLIKGHKAAPPPPPPKPGVPSSVFFSLRNGLGELVETLRAKLTGDVLLGERVTRIEDGGIVHTASGLVIEAACVISTVASKITGETIAEAAPELSAALAEIKYASSATITLGYKESELARPLDGFGFVVAADDPTHLRASTWSSTKFLGRTPEGYALMRVFVGGHRCPDDVFLSDEELVALARTELKNIMGLEAEPVITRIYRWVDANPQYEVGHLDRIARLRELCPPWLQLVGADYEGGGVPDCVRTGREVARQVASQLQAAAV